jgi:methyl-accepting chemotaxis protein
MTLRARLLFLSLFVAISIAVVSLVFWLTLTSLARIDAEKGQLTRLGDAVLQLSIVVNSLDSAQYGAVSKKFHDALTQSDQAFDDVGKLSILPKLDDELAKAFEIIGNMRSLMTDDLKSLDQQYTSFEPDLHRYFGEAYSTTVRMFYTNEHVTSKERPALLKRVEQLVTTINGLTETLGGVTDTIHDQSQVIGDETARLRDQSLIFALAVSGLILLATVLVSLVLGNSISRRVKRMQKQLLVVSQGDFSQALEVKGRDEISAITNTVNSLLDSLNRLLGQVRNQVEGLKALGTELSQGMGETAQAVETIETNLGSSHDQLAEQTRVVSGSVASARSLGQSTEHLSQAFREQLDILAASSAGIEEIIANIGSVNTNTTRAEDSSRILQEISREGSDKLGLVAGGVKEIARSSENLVKVTGIIDDIAARTNLLAMNASIEAAHAGEAGRGFGVVANEIRQLAEQAGLQAKSIGQDLGVVNESIQQIGSATTVAVEVFQKVVAQTALVGAIVQEVQGAMAEQARGGTLVLDGLRQLNEINARVGHAVEDLRRGETEILDRIQALADQNAHVNENNDAVLKQTREISGVVEKTNSLADTTKDRIVALEEETRQFRVRDEEPAQEPIEIVS